MITVVRDSGGDWIAVYRDDKLLMQGHSIQEEDLLRILEIDYRFIEQDLGDENHPYWGSQLPYDLNELKEATDKQGLKMTDDERKRQYEICKERGHVSSDIQLTSFPLQEVCAKCGTHYRYDRVLVEFDAPKGEL